MCNMVRQKWTEFSWAAFDLSLSQKEQMEGRWIQVKAPFSIYGDAQVSTAVTVPNLANTGIEVLGEWSSAEYFLQS